MTIAPSWLVLLFSALLLAGLAIAGLFWGLGAASDGFSSAYWRLWGDRRQDAKSKAAAADRAANRQEHLHALGELVGVSADDLSVSIENVSRKARELRVFLDVSAKRWYQANPGAAVLPPDFGVSLLDQWAECWRIDQAAFPDES